MCTTTTGTQAAAANSVRGIQPNTSGGTGGAGPGPDPEASTDQPLFGKPDYAPQLTFIAQASLTDNGFIALAERFHENSGLEPKTVQSIEEIIDILDDSTQSGTGHINRIRIVSHVFFDTSGQSQPINMLLRFLTAGSGPALKRQFLGFAGTEIDALKSMMTFELLTFTDISHFLYRGSSNSLLTNLRPAHNTILSNVPLDAFGEVEGEFNDFFKICGSKLILSRGDIPAMTQVSAIQEAYDILLEDIVTRISNTIPEPDLNTLKNAILALGTGPIISHQSPHNPSAYGQNVTAALAAIAGSSFSTKLNRVRQRFNQNSKVDIRGCQVGREVEFLEAIRAFFGQNQTIRPAVSGPRWFQHFNQIGNITGLTSNNRIIGLHNNGIAPYSANDVRGFLDDWCNAYGIADAHLTFWQQKFALNVLDFCALGWRSSLPNTRILISRLQSINSATFNDFFGELAAIFLVAANRIPSAAQRNSVSSVLPNLTTFATQLDATIANGSTPTQLTQHYNNFKTIYESVDNRFTNTSSPNASQRVIPATAPSPLTIGIARDLQTDLKDFIDTHARSRFRPFKRFMDAALTNTQDEPAKMRYFLCLGLPFLVYNTDATNVNENLLITFLDGTAANSRQNDAIKYWIRAQWRGFIPNTLGDNTTFNSSRQTPWLVENRQPTPSLTVHPYRVSPTTEFQDEIESITP